MKDYGEIRVRLFHFSADRAHYQAPEIVFISKSFGNAERMLRSFGSPG